MSTEERVERLRKECFVAQRHLNEQRACLEDQKKRVQYAEESLQACLKAWEAARDVLAEELKRS